MIIKEAREHYYYFSGALSSVTRQLCFSGIAVIWVFSINENPGEHFLNKELFLPLICFVLALSFDLLHYMAGAAIWGIYSRCKEKKGVLPDQDLAVKCEMNWPTNFFFWGKSYITILGYVFLLSQIGKLLLGY